MRRKQPRQGDGKDCGYEDTDEKVGPVVHAVRRYSLAKCQLADLELNECSDVSRGLLQLVVSLQSRIQLDVIVDRPTEASRLRRPRRRATPCVMPPIAPTTSNASMPLRISRF